MYLSEQDRFKRVGELNTKASYQKEEKQMNDTRYLAKISRIQGHQKGMVDAVKEISLKKDIEDKKQVQLRSTILQAYEDVLFLAI